MLILSRKKNESIVINDNITVTIIEIRGDKVRLGIVSPKEIPIHRQEVFEAMRSQETLPPAAPLARIHADCPTCTCPRTPPENFA